MRGNLAMMNWAQIRLSSPPHRTFGAQTAMLAGSTWSLPALNCHTTKIKPLTFWDEEFPGRVIKDEPELWLLADEGEMRRERKGGTKEEWSYGGKKSRVCWCTVEQQLQQNNSLPEKTRSQIKPAIEKRRRSCLDFKASLKKRGPRKAEHSTKSSEKAVEVGRAWEGEGMKERTEGKK